MSTLTIRNMPPEIIEGLKARALRNGRSMEAEVRHLLCETVLDRTLLLALIEHREDGAPRLKRRPSAEEVDGWLHASRHQTP